MGSSDEPQGRYPWRRHWWASQYKTEDVEVGAKMNYMSRQVFPQAPSPTMTSLRRISAICAMGVNGLRVVVKGQKCAR